MHQTVVAVESAPRPPPYYEIWKEVLANGREAIEEIVPSVEALHELDLAHVRNLLAAISRRVREIGTSESHLMRFPTTTGRNVGRATRDSRSRELKQYGEHVASIRERLQMIAFEGKGSSVLARLLRRLSTAGAAARRYYEEDTNEHRRKKLAYDRAVNRHLGVEELLENLEPGQEIAGASASQRTRRAIRESGAPTRGQAPTRVFVAYDFEIGGTLTDDLDAVADNPPPGYLVDWPGDAKGRKQGNIWAHKVRPGIGESDRLVAFVDLPNANVGFEVGYALGLGKAVALARIEEGIPAWLRRPPFNGYLFERISGVALLRELVAREEKDWVPPPRPPRVGKDVLHLCPWQSGESYRQLARRRWRELPPDGWALEDLTELLEGVGRVVWIIAPHNEGPQGRDGTENAALSVVAGFLYALDGVNLEVFVRTGARPVADILSHAWRFGSRWDLKKLLEDKGAL